MATLNIATMAFGGVSARLLRLPRGDTITLILETEFQNALLGITYAEFLNQVPWPCRRLSTAYLCTLRVQPSLSALDLYFPTKLEDDASHKSAAV